MKRFRDAENKSLKTKTKTFTFYNSANDTLSYFK